MNILWICIEHLRYDTIAALGNPHIRTPNLDRLVGRGVAFTHNYCQNPVCTPSRASFLTGRYPAATEVRQNGQNIPRDEVLVTRELADAGWRCGLAGKLHVCTADRGTETRVDDGYTYFKWSHGATQKHGGDWVTWLGEQGLTVDDVYHSDIVLQSRKVDRRDVHQTTWCFDRALEFIDRCGDTPWLVSVNPFAAHDPFDYLPELFDRYDPDGLPTPTLAEGELDNKPPMQQLARRCSGYDNRGFDDTTEDERRRMVAAYYATVEHIDAELGRAMDHLDRTGQTENTVIIYHADHGEMLGDHGLFAKGSFFYDPAVRVPMVWSMPGTLPEGMVCEAMVEQVDIVPTLYELVGSTVPRRVQGRSLLGLMRGEVAPEDHRDGALCEFYYSNRVLPDSEAEPVYATMWRTPTHKIVVHHGTDLGELYDMQADPGEVTNLWNDPGSAALKCDLVKQCFDAKVWTTDPLPERVGNY